MTEVKVGQIWQDIDPRMEGRQIEVIHVGNGFAACKNLKTNKETRIALKRFKSNATGYKLIKDVSP